MVDGSRQEERAVYEREMVPVRKKGSSTNGRLLPSGKKGHLQTVDGSRQEERAIYEW